MIMIMSDVSLSSLISDSAAAVEFIFCMSAVIGHIISIILFIL